MRVGTQRTPNLRGHFQYAAANLARPSPRWQTVFIRLKSAVTPSALEGDTISFQAGDYTNIMERHSER